MCYWSGKADKTRPLEFFFVPQSLTINSPLPGSTPKSAKKFMFWIICRCVCWTITWLVPCRLSVSGWSQSLGKHLSQDKWMLPSGVVWINLCFQQIYIWLIIKVYAANSYSNTCIILNYHQLGYCFIKHLIIRNDLIYCDLLCIQMLLDRFLKVIYFPDKLIHV